MNRTGIRIAFALLLVLVGALALALLAQGRSRSIGQALYAGELPLEGRIAGHEAALPTEASRCVNCHSRALSGAAPADTRGFGPPLTAEALQRKVARRGGPPSSYEPDSFCRLLRTGVDPAQIIVQRAMPHYSISAEDCGALWNYLSEAAP